MGGYGECEYECVFVRVYVWGGCVWVYRYVGGRYGFEVRLVLYFRSVWLNVELVMRIKGIKG